MSMLVLRGGMPPQDMRRPHYGNGEKSNDACPSLQQTHGGVSKMQHRQHHSRCGIVYGVHIFVSCKYLGAA
jgi:hypothetical protein